MENIKWFNRKFDFAFDQNIFPSIIERLEGTPLRLRDKINKVPAAKLTPRYNDQWSIQENVGHLLDLEPLWQGRLDDLLSDQDMLRSADLENTKTHLAKHNEVKIDDLLTEFERLRSHTVNKLKTLTLEEVYKTALHPRLLNPMRTMDLFLFVAEHDDHHLATINRLNLLN